MTDKDLKKLNRRELLEMLIAQSKKVDRLQSQLEAAQKQLSEKQFNIEECGSIAEAALKVNGVFEAAQAAGQQYLDNISRISGEQQKICDRRLAETETQCEKMIADTKSKCDEMIRKAESESKTYWDTVSGKMNAFCEEHTELKKLFSEVSVAKGR